MTEERPELAKRSRIDQFKNWSQQQSYHDEAQHIRYAFLFKYPAQVMAPKDEKPDENDDDRGLQFLFDYDLRDLLPFPQNR